MLSPSNGLFTDVIHSELPNRFARAPKFQKSRHQTRLFEYGGLSEAASELSEQKVNSPFATGPV